MANSLHWTEKAADPNIRKQQHAPHINRPRISSSTILRLLELKGRLLGVKLDILKEAARFEEQPDPL